MAVALITTTASPTGSVYKDDGNWNTCRTSATGESTADGTGTQQLVLTQFDVGGGNIYKIRRSFFQFIVSSIPAGARVQSAKFILKRTGGTESCNNGSCTLYIRSSTQPDSQAISTNHYNDLGGTTYATLAFTSISDGSDDIEITLNASAITALQAEIAAASIFKLQCRMGKDVNNQTPSAGNNLTNYNLDACQLEVTYIIETITAKASIKKELSQSITSKANIKATTNQSIETKGNIKSLIAQTIQSAGNIRGDTWISAKASIKKELTQTIQSKGSIKKSSTQSVSAKARMSRFITETITAKAKIYGHDPTTKIIKVVARINPSQGFIDEVEKTVRQMSRKLEIQWDGINWTDESVYLLNAQGNEKLSKTSGEGIATVLDVELDNTDERFTPDNTSSPLYGYIKPRVNIKISIVMSGYTYRMFTGYIKNIHPDTKSRVCSLECFDNQVLIYNKRANGIVYKDKRSDQLLSTLAELADLTSDQFDFDIGTLIVNFGYFEDRNVWPIMGEIAVAERGRIFFDRYGLLRFWNRDKLHNRGYNITLTLNDWISDLDYSVAEHEIKNTIIVKAMPRASAGIQIVWSSGNAEYLNPYSDTLVWIPAGESQVAFLELEDPCTTFITPIRNTDFTANSSQDGSGNNLTNNIEIHEFINYGDAVYITVGNIGDTDAYLTKFQIRGNPARVLKWIKVTAKEQPSIDRYGRQEFEIENNFIQDENAANEIAYEELWRRKDAINLFKLNIVGIPHLLCGDVVRVEYRASEYKNYMIDQLDWTLNEGGFKQKLTLVNPYIFPEIQRISARGYIVKGHYIKTITAKARILGKKDIEAKANIKVTQNYTIQSKGNIT